MSIQKVDANTIVLYPLTTFSDAGAKTTTLDTVTGSFSDTLTWSEVDTANRTKTFQISGSDKIVKWKNGLDVTTGPGGTSLETISASYDSYTVMGWIYKSEPSASYSIMRLHGGSGGSEAVNYTLSVNVMADQQLQVFQEYGVGQDGSATDTSGSISTKKWNHFAVTKEKTGISASFNFYVNGVATSTDLVRTNCTGGDDPASRKLDVGDFGSEEGALHAVQWDSIVRTPSEISAAAATYEPAWDENTFAAWSFEQEPFTEDIGPDKLHLWRERGTVSTGSDLSHSGMFVENGNLSTLDSSKIDNHSLYQTLTGSYTVEMVYGAGTNTPTDILWGFGAVGESEFANIVQFQWLAPRKLKYFGEKDGGTNIDFSFNNSVESGFVSSMNYWGFVRELTGTSSSLTIYRNGIWFDSGSIGNNTSAFGAHWLTVIGRAVAADGTVADFKLSNIPLSASHFANVANQYQSSGSITSVLYGGLVGGSTQYNVNSPPGGSTFSWIVDPNYPA